MLNQNRHTEEINPERELPYSEKLRKASLPDAFKIPVTINYESPETQITIGETFIPWELSDTADEGSIKSPVNRILNIKALGKVLGQGATNTGIEVLEVEGMSNLPFEAIVKAYRELKVEKSARAVIYQLDQAHRMHELGLAGVGPKYLGMVVQEAPITNQYGDRVRFFVPVMEKVGEQDIEEISNQPLTKEERNDLRRELIRLFTEADKLTKDMGFIIGDHGVRVTKRDDGTFRTWIIDIGFVPAELGLDFDPKETANKYVDYNERVQEGTMPKKI